jgi:acetyl esterase/lipase
MTRIRNVAILAAFFTPLVSCFHCAIPQALTNSLNKNQQGLQMADAASEASASGTKSSSARDVDSTKKSTGGTVGNWEELHGNWVLRPSSSETPRALLHFLGGALVGASPHVAYRYMLERLAEKGFLVVATPYQLSFDHLKSCDEIITKFEALAPSIARQYGAVPVVGVGHSLGSLLQLLITCLFPDTPRAANALISFNNPAVTDAVPFFEEVFAPLFTSIAATNGTLPNSNDALAMSLSLAKAATEGK